MTVRKANDDDMPEIYMMGYDTWAEGASRKAFLKICSDSTKYKMGEWYVLQKCLEKKSSLLLWKFSENSFGLGSIATAPEFRGYGYATKLIEGVLEKLDKRNPDAVVFLYADIGPEFYKKFGFLELPKDLQKYQTTTCMIRGDLFPAIKIPDYF